MSSWQEFEKHAPRLASLGVKKLNRQIAYLAILKRDGSPTLHPITPFIGNEMLFMFTEPSSPKINALRRGGRYALHCAVRREQGQPLQEFLVSGIAKTVTDPESWISAAHLAASLCRSPSCGS